MRLTHTLAAIGLVALSIAPAVAADAMANSMSGDAMKTDAMASDAMGTMGMMESGEVMTFMPDGHMGKMMVTDPAMMDSMSKMATPIDHCMMIMTGSDGKTYMVDTSSPEAMKECEKMAM